MFEICNDGACGTRLVADRPIRKGTIVHAIRVTEVLERATYQSIQIAPHRHILDDGIIIYLNHSCRPSTIIDTVAQLVRAERDIAAGEELSFFYPTTEWSMDRPFICRCGAQQCVRLVAGARFLPIDTLAHYRLSSHILGMIQESLTQRSARHDEHRDGQLAELR